MTRSGELGADVWLTTIQPSSARVSQVVAKLRSAAAERIVPLISWIQSVREYLLEVTWGLEEGPPPHLDAITDCPRLDDLMRRYYEEVEEGQDLCATLEDRCYDDDDDIMEDVNNINPNIDSKDNDNLTDITVNHNNNNNDKNNKSNNNNDDNNDCGDNNKNNNDYLEDGDDAFIQALKSNDNNNNNISNDNNNNNNNNGDDCDLREDDDDTRIQVIQVIATNNGADFAGYEDNNYNIDSGGSGRWVQRTPPTILAIFGGGRPFGERIILRI
ncbi:hypothetical protein CBR_g11108 [Chara braunii]|uniref:Uncharacterized protein n=1 Tax=Chara braunii TaxID=69332 RepID=A0A388KQ49_CHABU|nr:hypothetical protein CBR_g11108 [Chara braunii]|eukprot:GBG72175.1 hypothetical protein CBR_g11108 [Chara braunii]